MACRGSGGRKKKCPFCKAYHVSKLCDFPMQHGKTCDAEICDNCATTLHSQETDLGHGLTKLNDTYDVCPIHKAAAQALAASVPSPGAAEPGAFVLPASEGDLPAGEGTATASSQRTRGLAPATGDSKAARVFHQQDGEVTRAYYAELNRLGPSGQFAVALFRAQKRSSAAKRYRGGGFRGAAYDVKTWSMGEICRLAPAHYALAIPSCRPEDLGELWGWKQDPKVLFGGRGEEGEASWVLYVELPHGQASFHSPTRLGSGPDFRGVWDGIRGVGETRILAFCDLVMFGEGRR